MALDNMRAVVFRFHSVLAYLNFLPAAPFSFNSPPYLWRAFPIVDTARWFGFDLFCAWQDVFLMSLFFFLSGLFVWRSLERKGPRTFLHYRVVRLGLPFCLRRRSADAPGKLSDLPADRCRSELRHLLAPLACVAVLTVRTDVVF